MKNMPKNYVMVLNDGETYTGLGNCKVIAIDDALFNEHDADDDIDNVVAAIYEAGKTGNGEVVAEFSNNGVVIGGPIGANLTFLVS